MSLSNTVGGCFNISSSSWCGRKNYKHDMTLSQAPSLKNWTGRDPVLGFEGDIDYFDVLLFKYQSRSHNFKKLFFVPSPEVVQVNDSVITFHYPGLVKKPFSETKCCPKLLELCAREYLSWIWLIMCQHREGPSSIFHEL